MYIYCIHLFMSLFRIPSQSVFGKSFAKPLEKAFRKTSNDNTNLAMRSTDPIQYNCSTWPERMSDTKFHTMVF